MSLFEAVGVFSTLVFTIMTPIVYVESVEEREKRKVSGTQNSVASSEITDMKSNTECPSLGISSSTYVERFPAESSEPTPEPVAPAIKTTDLSLSATENAEFEPTDFSFVETQTEDPDDSLARDPHIREIKSQISTLVMYLQNIAYMERSTISGIRQNSNGRFVEDKTGRVMLSDLINSDPQNVESNVIKRLYLAYTQLYTPHINAIRTCLHAIEDELRSMAENQG